MKTRDIVASLAVLLVSNLWSTSASAVPAFSRQTGQACASCHFQHYPALNAYGRAFKAGAYTQTGGQSMVQGDDLSIPVVLNASLITKIRYQRTNGSDKTVATNTGELQFPDEAALLIGGRAYHNFGSFKTHFNNPGESGNFGAVVFSTDAGGAGYGFELLNSGAVRFQRITEDRTATSAQQFIGLGSGAAEGVAFVASSAKGFVNATLP